MTHASKEACKKEACDIQACLSKNNFLPQRYEHNRKERGMVAPRCVRVIENLQSCCEKCEYKSTHCGSVSGLLKQIPKR